MTRTPFAGLVHVHYRQVYVCDGDAFPDVDVPFAGQVNGLLGAGQPGVLVVTTGLHTGEVGLTVELAAGQPPVGDAWDDVVEVPWTVSDGEVAVVERAGDDRHPVDEYLLTFWPAAPAPDAVVRSTSEYADSWHRVARGAQ